MGLPGTYIKVTTPSGQPYIVPYSTKFGFQCQQIWFKPLEELFSYLKNLAGSFPVVGSAIDTYTGVRNILGKQFLNMAFSAQAWKGEEPVTISIILPFFMGMNDKWNAKEEVYIPIMAIMKETVPQIADNKLEINAPGPTAIDVYKSYGNQMFQYIGNIGAAIAQSFQTSASDVAGGNAGEATTVQTMRNTWSFEVGYSKDGSTINNKYIGLSNLIVRSSGFAFATEVDDKNAPINGEVTLSLSAQTIIVSTDFNAILEDEVTSATAPE